MTHPNVYVLTRYTCQGDQHEVRSVHVLYETAAEHAERLAGFKLTWVEHNAHGRWWESDYEATGRSSWWTIVEVELLQ